MNKELTIPYCLIDSDSSVNVGSSKYFLGWFGQVEILLLGLSIE
ncbi:MAG: hypothetical protein Q8942_02610 [Bacillota bacterium]|nr:hypothetical protein [Bacillota bacterium]